MPSLEEIRKNLRAGSPLVPVASMRADTKAEAPSYRGRIVHWDFVEPFGTYVFFTLEPQREDSGHGIKTEVLGNGLDSVAVHAKTVALALGLGDLSKADFNEVCKAVRLATEDALGFNKKSVAASQASWRYAKDADSYYVSLRMPDGSALHAQFSSSPARALAVPELASKIIAIMSLSDTPFGEYPHNDLYRATEEIVKDAMSKDA